MDDADADRLRVARVIEVERQRLAQNSIRPASGFVTPQRMRISVLLPAPLPPTSPSTSPRAM